MDVDHIIVNVNSPQPERLIAYYRDVVQLPPVEGMGPGAFNVGSGSSFIIDGHSKVTGNASQPERVLLNLMISDIAKEHDRLAAAGAKVVRDKGREYWGGIISTFEDPDGNYYQLIEFRPELAQAEPA
jgi:predicted enzyme related to lactoylglutathione lyase